MAILGLGFGLGFGLGLGLGLGLEVRRVRVEHKIAKIGKKRGP